MDTITGSLPKPAGASWRLQVVAAQADGAADLMTNATNIAAVGPGMHQRMYRSAHTLGSGEGMSYEGPIPEIRGRTLVPRSRRIDGQGRRPRQQSLGRSTPIEYETIMTPTATQAA
ncbi:hypothetical protein [Nocardioides sp. NPDC006273]|uniref:hypothetical protein n=1 Tax=Nocardioides sp. NPDC006273 TaxID=3155598 RepID=UPI0033AF7A65